MTVEYLAGISHALDLFPIIEYREILGTLNTAIEQGKTIYLFGNGGSALNASHIAGDFIKNTGRHIKVRALTDSNYLITSYANDNRYDDIFWLQMEDSLEKGDVVIALSGSGRSINIVKAVGNARVQGAVTIALTGRDGGYIKNMVDICLVVGSDVMEQIEDVHLMIGHMLTTELRCRK